MCSCRCRSRKCSQTPSAINAAATQNNVVALLAELINFLAPETTVWKAVGMAVAAGAIALAGASVFRKGLSALAKGKLNINALMMVAVAGAFVIGQWPEAAMVMALYSLAELIEARAVASCDLRKLEESRSQRARQSGQAGSPRNGPLKVVALFHSISRLAQRPRHREVLTMLCESAARGLECVSGSLGQPARGVTNRSGHASRAAAYQLVGSKTLSV